MPDSDAVTGRDLWVQDGQGNDRLIAKSVYRAKFSPDGQSIAYTTSDCILRVEDLQGNKTAEVQGAYEPNWKPDGTEVVFSKVPVGRDVHQPETFHLATLNPATGKYDLLTDGSYDDGRAQYNPANNRILFVSGGRSGLASFWEINQPGDKPVQVTNFGQTDLGENFVPTPYHRTVWSQNGQWFVFDFISCEKVQTWGLKFCSTGNFESAKKLGDGLDPQW